MKKIIIIAILLFLPSLSTAGYIQNQTIEKFYVGNYVYFGVTNGVTNPPPGACTTSAYQFKFDTSTMKGKNMYMAFLAAKIKEIPIRIWYKNSTEGSGECTTSVVAEVTFIGYH